MPEVPLDRDFRSLRTPEQQAARDAISEWASTVDLKAYRCKRHPNAPLVYTVIPGFLYCHLCIHAYYRLEDLVHVEEVQPA